jgi:hypothetical protein
MALKKCPECKKDVSTKATKCPNCGAPVKKKSGCGTLLLVGLGVFLLLGLLPTCLPDSSGPISDSARVDDAAAKAQRFEAAKQRFETTIEEKYAELQGFVEKEEYSAAVPIIRQFETFGRIDFRDVGAMANGIRTKDALARLAKTTDLDIENLAGIYSELEQLQPDNEDYAANALKYGGILKRRAAEQAAREKRQAEQLAQEAARQRLIESQFSAWDGSHNNLERLIKKTMNDPDSYEHVETRYGESSNNTILVKTTFRGKNAFGGTVTNWVRARYTLDGQLVEVIDQGP